jgi:hypothetical protein
MKADIVDGVNLASAGAEYGFKAPDFKDRQGLIGHQTLPASFLSSCYSWVFLTPSTSGSPLVRQLFPIFVALSILICGAIPPRSTGRLTDPSVILPDIDSGSPCRQADHNIWGRQS